MQNAAESGFYKGLAQITNELLSNESEAVVELMEEI